MASIFFLPTFALADGVYKPTTKIQIEATNKFIKRALKDVGRYVGLNCKNWARIVIKDASGGKIILPPTHPDAYGWLLARYNKIERIDGDVAELINMVTAGDIIQMNWKPGMPHTAIVLRIDKDWLEFIESNWKEKETVFTRKMKINDFIKKTFKYSVYRIIES